MVLCRRTWDIWLCIPYIYIIYIYIYPMDLTSFETTRWRLTFPDTVEKIYRAASSLNKIIKRWKTHIYIYIYDIPSVGGSLLFWETTLILYLAPFFCESVLVKSSIFHIDFQHFPPGSQAGAAGSGSLWIVALPQPRAGHLGPWGFPGPWTAGGSSMAYPMTHPWDERDIYRSMNGWCFFMVNVGKYTSPMDGMGM